MPRVPGFTAPRRLAPAPDAGSSGKTKAVTPNPASDLKGSPPAPTAVKIKPSLRRPRLTVGGSANSEARKIENNVKNKVGNAKVSASSEETKTKVIRENDTESAIGNSEVSGTQSKQVYMVLHTKRSAKKRKTWDDGVLVLEKNKAVLYEMDGKVMGRSSYKHNHEETLPDGCTLTVASREIEVGARAEPSAFESGRLFLNGQANGLAAGGRAPWTLSAAGSAVVPGSKPFKRVVLGASNVKEGTKKAPPLPLRALHSETSPNALVLLHSNPERGVGATVVDPKLSKLLRPHQCEGVQFLFNNVSQSKGAILADEMGLGKTLQCITLIWTVLKQGPRGAEGTPWCQRVVVVTPSSLVKNWDAEFRKWLGRERIEPYVVSGTAKEAAATIAEFSRSKIRRVLIVSYETYRKQASAINATSGIDLVICDEGHRLKSASGNQTITALQGCKTRRRILLTGTPVQNNLAEFYAMVDFVAPGALGSDVRSFQRIFQAPIERGTDRGASADDREMAAARSEELKNLTSGFILRRTAAVNEKFLPPRTDVNVFVRLCEDQVKSYKSYVQDHLYGNSAGSGGTDALKLIHYLRQICTHPALVNQDETNSEKPTQLSGGDQFSRTISGKLCLLQTFLRQIRAQEPSARIVLVSNSTKTLNLIEVMLRNLAYGFLRLDGSTTASDRQGLVNRFNAPYRGDPLQLGFPFAFLLSARAGGCGLNLIGANRLILLDLDWNPATDQQAAARIWRDGQPSPVFIYRFIATGTIEERIFQRQEVKLSSAEGILKDGSGTKSSSRALKNSSNKGAKFSRAELKQLFEYNANTECDTYDLMTKKATAEESKHLWDAYSGPESIPDSAMRVAAENLGCELVTWVHAQERKTASSSEDEFPNEEADGEDDASLSNNSDSEDTSEKPFSKSSISKPAMATVSSSKIAAKYKSDDNDNDGECDPADDDEEEDDEDFFNSAFCDENDESKASSSSEPKKKRRILESPDDDESEFEL